MEETEIPDDKPVYMKSWDTARDLVTKQMADMLKVCVCVCVCVCACVPEPEPKHTTLVAQR